MKITLAEARLIFDDTDDQYYRSHEVQIAAGVHLPIAVTKMISFTQFAEALSSAEVEFILKNCPHIEQFMRFDNTIAYRGQDKLGVYVQPVNQFLVVISTGEFQPARYKIYVEGVFEIVS